MAVTYKKKLQIYGRNSIAVKRVSKLILTEATGGHVWFF